MPPLLYVLDLEVTYGAVLALDGVSLSLDAGGLLTVRGPNGAGKTTLLRAVSGLLDLHGGRVTGGRVDVAAARSDIAHVLEGRRVFPDLTVEENLRVGAFGVGSRAEGRDRVAWALDRFPLLPGRRHLRAGHLSGGEQQLLVIARAALSRPRLLLLDEPVVGLAHEAVVLVSEVVAELRAHGTAVMVAEQEARLSAAALGGGPVLRLVGGHVAAGVTA